MMESNHSISAIVPVYNGEKYIAEAIESILHQTHCPQEIIIIDDGSTDNTSQEVKGFGGVVQYHYQPNQGSAAARNSGVHLAQGEFLAFLDADDLWTKNKLQLQLQVYAVDPRVEMVLGQVQQFHSPELSAEVKQQIKIPAEYMPGKHVGAMLVKHDTFRKVGLLNTNLVLADFIDWYVRAEEMKIPTIMLPQVVMKRRLHQNSLGTYKKQHRSEYVQVIKASLDRRRRASTDGENKRK